MRKVLFVTTILNFFLVAVSPVTAQSDFDTDIGLSDPIEIDYFPILSLPGPEYTVLSWLSFLGLLLTLGFILFWIFLILRAVSGLYQNADTPEGLTDAFTKLRSLFIGLILTFVFPIGMSILGSVLGIGMFWTWPAAFRECNDEENFTNLQTNNIDDITRLSGRTDYSYYFQAILDLEEETGESGEALVQRAYDYCNISP